MCGIAGIYSFNTPINIDNLSRGMGLIRHRGPDSSGQWSSNDKRVALGHNRLSIIDINGGYQPLTSADGSIVTVANGEFYGYEVIRNTLQKKGYPFKTNSDSEILIALYQEYGLNLFSHLRGEFSFMLWDDKNKLLLISRDRFGIKPLFHSKYKDKYFIASEIKTILAMGVKPEWNYSKVLQLETETSPADQTIFKGVFSVKPGHYMILKNNSIRDYSYWDFSFPTLNTLSPNNISDEEYIEEFSVLFEQSVKIRLRSDVPVGCYLSGGIDSASILGTMSLFHDKPIDTFTLSFPKQENYNEYDQSKKMAKFAKANHHTIEVNHKRIAENFFNCIWHNESTIANTSPVAKFILSGVVRDQGYKVVLTGEGADEIFAGYSPFVNDMIAHSARAATTPSNISQNAIYDIKLNDNIDFSYISNKIKYIPHFMKLFCSRSGSFDQLRNYAFSEFAKKQVFGKALIDSINIRSIDNIDQLNKTLYIWSKSMLPNVMLSAMGDRMEMGNSIEARLPFLDHKLVEFSTKLPINMKIRDGIEKYIVRMSRKHVVDNSILTRKKRPFVAPGVIYSDNAMLDFMKEIFNSSLLEELPFYDKKKVLSLLKNKDAIQSSMRPTMDMMLTHILSLCTLQSLFKIS